jgi:hypothetical protein
MPTPAVPYSYVQRQLLPGVPQSVPFPYLARSHVKLFRNYNLLTARFDQLLVPDADFSWINDFTISVNSGLTGVLTILRETPVDSRLVDWANGSNLTAFPMDTADLQVFYAFQELWDRGVITGIAAAEASALVAPAVTYIPVTNLSGLPISPATGLRVSVYNSTSIETLAATGMPAGFQGGPQFRVRLRWGGSAWQWEGYEALDPDARYLSAAGSSATKVANKAALPTTAPEGASFIVVDSTGIELTPAPTGTPPGFVGDPGLQVHLTRGPSGWIWDRYEATDPESRYGNARLSSTDIPFTAPTAAHGATVDFTVALGRFSELTKVSSSHPCWLRLYRSAGQRLLDTRLGPGGTLQAMIDLGDGKPYAEFVTTVAPQTIVCNPPAGILGDESGLAHVRLVNRSGDSRAITGILTIIQLES